MGWTGDQPLEPGEMAKFYEQQIEAARDASDNQPLTAPEFARKYEQQVERAREQAFREARNYFMQKANDDETTQRELAEIFEMSQAMVSRILRGETGAAGARLPGDD